MKTRRTSVLAALLLAAVTAAGLPAGAAETGPLRFSAIPQTDPAEGRRRFAPLADYLAGRLGIAVEFVPAADTEAALGALREGRTRLAWLDGVAGLRAWAALSGARPIAQAPADRRATSCFILHVETRYPWLGGFADGVRGKSLLLGPPGSTAGHLMPAAFVHRETGQAPEALFSGVAHSRGPLDTLARVQAGDYQAGALDCAVWDAESRAGRVIAATVRLLWRTTPYPDEHWSVAGDLDARWGIGTTERLQRALVELDDQALLRALGRAGFEPVTAADFAPVRQAAESAGLPLR